MRSVGVLHTVVSNQSDMSIECTRTKKEWSHIKCCHTDTKILHAIGFYPCVFNIYGRFVRCKIVSTDRPICDVYQQQQHTKDKPRMRAPISSLVSSFTRNKLDSGFFVLKNAVIFEPSSRERKMSFTLCMSFGTDNDRPPVTAAAIFFSSRRTI